MPILVLTVFLKRRRRAHHPGRFSQACPKPAPGLPKVCPKVDPKADPQSIPRLTPNRSPPRMLDFAVRPSNANHLLVGTGNGTISHLLRHGRKASPQEYLGGGEATDTPKTKH